MTVCKMMSFLMTSLDDQWPCLQHITEKATFQLLFFKHLLNAAFINLINLSNHFLIRCFINHVSISNFHNFGREF